MAESSTPAQQRWELENDIQEVDAGDDAYYKYDYAGQQALQAQKPWAKDPHYFKQCVHAHCAAVWDACGYAGTHASVAHGSHDSARPSVWAKERYAYRSFGMSACKGVLSS